MAEETFGYLFVGNIPLLCEKKKVAKQYQVETWLDLAQVVKELGLETVNQTKPASSNVAYIV